jgi:hypothetical protein
MEREGTGSPARGNKERERNPSPRCWIVLRRKELAGVILLEIP